MKKINLLGLTLRHHSAPVWLPLGNSCLWIRHQQGLSVAEWCWQWRLHWQWPTAGDGCSRCGQGERDGLLWQSSAGSGTAVPNVDGAFVVEDIAGAVSAAEGRDVVVAAGTAGAGSNHRKPAKIR